MLLSLTPKFSKILVKCCHLGVRLRNWNQRLLGSVLDYAADSLHVSVKGNPFSLSLKRPCEIENRQPPLTLRWKDSTQVEIVLYGNLLPSNKFLQEMNLWLNHKLVYSIMKPDIRGSNASLVYGLKRRKDVSGAQQPNQSQVGWTEQVNRLQDFRKFQELFEN